MEVRPVWVVWVRDLAALWRLVADNWRRRRAEARVRATDLFIDREGRGW